MKLIGKFLAVLLLACTPSVLALQPDDAVTTNLDEVKKDPSRVVALDLSGQTFEEFPEEVFSCRSLRRLMLNETALSEIPERIAELKSLETLEFNHLKKPNLDFKRLPKNLVELRELKYVGLIGLPHLDWDASMEVLAQLPKLDNLALMKNELRALPKGIERLVSLRKIWLGGNTELDPAEVFAKLPRLEQIGFGGSGYEKLPSNVSHVPELFNLWLANNRITSLEPLKSLQKLRQLTLNSNGLTKVPVGLGDLKSVESLSLSDNPGLGWEELVQELASMPSLSQLSLANNGITRLPERFRDLSQLKVLILRGNDIASHDRKEIKQMLPRTQVVF